MQIKLPDTFEKTKDFWFKFKISLSSTCWLFIPFSERASTVSKIPSIRTMCMLFSPKPSSIFKFNSVFRSSIFSTGPISNFF